ncbi:MAG: hypothetical protein ACRDPF_34700, partial [Streptosporangiaceae bacterium]
VYPCGRADRAPQQPRWEDAVPRQLGSQKITPFLWFDTQAEQAARFGVAGNNRAVSTATAFSFLNTASTMGG